MELVLRVWVVWPKESHLILLHFNFLISKTETVLSNPPEELQHLTMLIFLIIWNGDITENAVAVTLEY